MDLPDEILTSIPRGGDELLVQLKWFQGQPRLDIRWWYQDCGYGPLLPTKRGIGLRLAEIDEVCQALQEGARKAQELKQAQGRTVPATGSLLDRMLQEAKRRAEG